MSYPAKADIVFSLSHNVEGLIQLVDLHKIVISPSKKICLRGATLSTFFKRCWCWPFNV